MSINTFYAADMKSLEVFYMKSNFDIRYYHHVTNVDSVSFLAERSTATYNSTVDVPAQCSSSF